MEEMNLTSTISGMDLLGGAGDQARSSQSWQIHANTRSKINRDKMR